MAGRDFGAFQGRADVFSRSLAPSSAFGHLVPKPARLPGVVHSPGGERSRLWALHPVVYFIHTLCLSLLVPTNLQGFQASTVFIP